MAGALVSIVANARENFTNSGYVLATEGIDNLEELAMRDPSDIQAIVARFGSELAAACILHHEIAMRRYPTQARASGVCNAQEPSLQLIHGPIDQLRNQPSLERLECAVFSNDEGAVFGVSPEPANLERLKPRALEVLRCPRGKKNKNRRVLRPSEAAGFVQLYDKLEHPVDRALVMDSADFVEVQWAVQLMVSLDQIVQQLLPQLLPRVAYWCAYHCWLQGDERWKLPTAVLDTIPLGEVIATPNALFHIFVGHNLCAYRRFEDAARCYLAAFTEDKDFHECQFLDEQIKKATGLPLKKLYAESEDEALREVAKTLEHWQDTQERLLREAAERKEKVKKIEALCLESAAAFLMAECSSLDLPKAKIHLLLFYAEGLCMRHFEQHLFRNQLFGTDDALEYADVDTASATVQAKDPKKIADIKSSLSAECTRLLAAVRDIAAAVAEQDITELLEDESLWLSSSSDEPISANVMMDAFRERGRESAMFEKALRSFEETPQQRD